MTIRINTSEYERAHRRKPRGTGNWAFWMGDDTSDINKAHFIYGTYSKACKQANAIAKEVGAYTITVGS